MPAFQSLISGGQKRKSDYNEDSSRKRHAGTGSSSNGGGDKYWMVQWRNPQQKKHKTWDGDAILVLSDTKASMHDMESKLMGSGKLPSEVVREGAQFQFNGKELEVDRAVSREEFFSGSCFGSGTFSAPSAASSSRYPGPSKQFIPPISATPKTLYKPPNAERRGIPLQPVDLLSTIDNSQVKVEFPKLKVENSHWTANWRKQQSKKNKTWDGDAYVSHTGDKLVMISEEGKIMGTTAWKGDPLHSGYKCYIGGKELELDCEVSASQLPDIIGPKGSVVEAAPTPPLLLPPAASDAITSPAKKFVAPISFYGAAPKSKPKGPLHDPEAEDAVVMKAPNKEHARKYNTKNLPVVPVVLDPILARHMRPHQKEGVKFLYECVMGLRKHEGQGCILADEMGLGKTLQTISLVWTLLKQNPYSGNGPVVQKVLVVCPVSLCSNWRAEFHKWLGRDRVGVVVAAGEKNTIQLFTQNKNQQVLVIGYERLRTVVNQLSSCVPPIGLIICDEGHRLKSGNSKTAETFNALRTPRRVILSGTPIQNDLGEFHAMADFCNPNLLDDYSTFRRVYENPILKSRTPDCSAKELEIGEARSAQLLTISKSFVLRRDATLLKNYLPPKHEYVVFVTPTALQLAIFSKILNRDNLDRVGDSTAESLALISILTKISNSPILLKATVDKAKDKPQSAANNIKRAGIDDAVKLLPENAKIGDVALSGKLTALSKLLKIIYKNTDEKCVLVSHYTSTLNILEAFCKEKRYTYHRLDGQTPAAKRQELVNQFNKSSQTDGFLFLLSSKAGGVGINLIGASRLCLIDSDWNPSHDLQSMARIHRDGQKHPVFIYRFLTAGTIDENIYQRQVTKLGLSNSLMGSGSVGGSKSDSFSRKDLRDIFRIHYNTPSHTHDLLECPCRQPDFAADNVVSRASSPDSGLDSDNDMDSGFVVASQVKPAQLDKMDKAYLKKKKAGLASLAEWKHIDCLKPTAREDVEDDILQALMYTKEPETARKPTLQQKSQLDTLLFATDLDNVAATEDEANSLSVRHVPGGTVAFLFEKCSMTAVDEEVEFEKLLPM